MKRSLKQRLNFQNGLIAGLLVLLGFGTSCSEERPCMYGTPVVKYTIKGKVESTSNEVIAGARAIITIGNTNNNPYYKDTIFTDEAGRFVRTYDSRLRPTDDIYRITVNDPSGAFGSQIQPVSFKNVKFTGGDGNWDRGEATKEVEFHLIPKDK